ncbi:MULTISPECIES: hypothetical protein [unclassified Pseudofrankia]|uniref:hypothetical protein n=1 Tax=unclassified Pseudofrankia TaxID=2994372 RepID=UPI0008DAD2A0|nr:MULTISPECIES: hypothetical protein [unclassified Pseudofrankia]MDT3445881.1 hypothetical protein [Pseudofrankia sp. BMG5.37]OHV50687.1 hypothetical protein BCD48_10435 [Pseudofrankia sp. BMG5.36]
MAIENRLAGSRARTVAVAAVLLAVGGGLTACGGRHHRDDGGTPRAATVTDTGVRLASNSPLPWRVRAEPQATLDPVAELDVTKALILAGYQNLVTNRPYAEGLLVPGGSLTYRFPAVALPGHLELQADVGTQLALNFAFAADFVADLFGLDLGLLERADAVGCLEEAARDVGTGTSPSVNGIAAIGRAMLACGRLVEASPVVAAAMTVATAGVATVAAGLEGAVRAATGTDRVSIPITVARPADPCPAAAGKCLGVRSGDVDGDGRADQVGLTFREPTVGSPPSNLHSTLGVHAVLASTGQRHDVTADAVSIDVRWLGLSDVDGDGRVEVFVVVGGGAHSQTASPFEFRDATMRPSVGDLREVALDGAIISSAGITCRTVGGVAQVTQWGAHLTTPPDEAPVYRGTETTYIADAGHVPRAGTARQVSYTGTLRADGGPQEPREFATLAGAHCPGLKW